MKIAFVGKGGSGKTTLSALFMRYLAQTHPVMAFDADINQHLAQALGVSDEDAQALPWLGDQLDRIKNYLRGSNPRISSAKSMVKTTPPGRGSQLVTITGSGAIYDSLFTPVDVNMRLAVTGPFSQEDLGTACYHSKVGAVEMLLNHMVDGPHEYAVVDMTAGADAFASGLFTRFDVTFLVCEPTVRSVGVYRQYKGYAQEFGVRLAVIGNKVEDDADEAFLRAEVGSDLLACFGRSGYVKRMERGAFEPLTELEAENLAVFAKAQQLVDACQKDWPRYQSDAVKFHRLNAEAWANDRTGQDLTQQIDPDFMMSPEALEVAAA